MNKGKIIPVLILMVCLIFSVLSVGAAALPAMDKTQPVTLKISFEDTSGSPSKPISGAQFKIYKVASVNADATEYNLESAFASYADKITNLSDPSKLDAGKLTVLAGDLETLVKVNNFTSADEGTTDSNGKLTLPTDSTKPITPGLYLVAGEKCTSGGKVYYSTPSLVLLPNYDTGSKQWNYSVEVKPKYITGDYDSFTVTKIWADKSIAHPKDVTVRIYADGVLFDTVRLSDENNWSHTWENTKKGTKWSVSENYVSGFSYSCTLKGNIFAVTNTKAEEITTKGGSSETASDISVPPVTNPPYVPTTSGGGGSSGGGGTSPYYVPEGTVPHTTRVYAPVAPAPYTPHEVTRRTRTKDNPEDSTSVTPEEKEKLPQTGVLWWPVPLLLAAGIILIIAGITVKKKQARA